MKNVAVLGGGSSAYSAICLLSKAGFRVSLLTSRPSEWCDVIRCQLIDPGHNLKKILTGNLFLASSKPDEILGDADLVVVCAPVHAYTELLTKVFLTLENRDRPISIGVLYGQGGFNWMVESLMAKYKPRCRVNYWSVGLLPWICRTHSYGKEGINFGPKYRNIIATSSKECFENLNKKFLPSLSEYEFTTGAFDRADSFLSLTLSGDNQIIHPARCYGLSMVSPNGWRKMDEIPYFYRDFDDLSAMILSKLDGEYSLIKEYIKKHIAHHDFKHMMGYLDLDEFSYGVRSSDIKSSFRNSKTLWNIKPPVVLSGNGWSLDFSHRFFKDDLYYGLNIAKWFAEKFKIDTPVLDEIREWATRGVEKFKVSFDQHSGTPDKYGFIKLDEVENFTDT